MTDEVKKAVRELQLEMAETRSGLKNVESRLVAAESALREAAGSMHETGRRFDHFLARFEEVVEMLVEADSESLRRVAQVEQQQDALRERLEAVEKKLAS